MTRKEMEDKIRKLETELYNAIQRGNLMEEQAGRLNFENSTLWKTIQSLRAKIAKLQRQLNER
jgi:predicted  nucleic acid-binding Zn-ribbon protein